MCYCQVNWAQSVLACLAKSRFSFEKEVIFEKLNFLFYWKCACVNLSGQLGAVSAGHQEVFSLSKKSFKSTFTVRGRVAVDFFGIESVF